MANHLLTGARAIAIALLLSLAPLLMPTQGAHAEILPIPMNVQYDVTSVTSASAEETAVSPADDALQDSIIAVLENSNGDAERSSDESVPLVASPRSTPVDSIALFSEPDGRPHWGATPCWRPPTHLPIGA
ncbi:hypothetical protein [Roseomonas genomospecies 6]|uniref:hypothetical protein n=1 Tax=Roseomonas genomospecies 6 TaxID=214106 RepID=UPI0011F1DB35|nr:hypothetical protein [Roseomonas genomospecies 6]